MKLYHLSEQYRATAEALSAMEDLSIEEISDNMAAIGELLETKVVAVAATIKEMEAEADAIKKVQDEMSARRKALENKAETLRKYLLREMGHAGISKVSSPYFKVSVAKNPPSLKVTEEMVPEEYKSKRVVFDIDKSAIRVKLMAGLDVPGCELSQGERIAIR